MNKRAGKRGGCVRYAAVASGLAWLAALSGCAPLGSSVRLLSYKDPHFPEPYHVNFRQCVYRLGPDGDCTFVARADDLSRRAAGGTIHQYLSVNLYWKPLPGKTFADKSSVDATLRYVLVCDSGVATYTGTGFVFPRNQPLGKGLIANIESGWLKLDSQIGAPPELLGEARVTGTLVAGRNASATIDMQREMEQYSSGAQRP